MRTSRPSGGIHLGAAYEQETATLPALDGFQQSDEMFAVDCAFVDAEALGDGKKGRLGRLTWEFQTADTINRNRRLYPAAVCAIALEEFASRTKKNIVFGNLDHPSIFDMDSLIVRLSDAAVKIVEATLDGTNVRVVADILDNEKGRQLASILKVEGNPGVSQRALARWRDPTDEEREKYGIPDDEFVDVAEALRLITYDVVSEPGFRDAEGATVTEHNDRGVNAMKPDELKAKHPELYDLIFKAGKAAGVETVDVEAAVTTAIEARKPELIKEATEPLTTKITEIEAERQNAVESLTALKPLMVSLGIVNEQITDAEAATKVATAEARVTSLEGENKELKDKVAALEAKVAEAGRGTRIRAALEKVSAKYADHQAHDKIVTRTADLKIEDEEKALEAAAQIAAFIEDVNPALKGKKDPNTPPEAPVVESVLAGLLKANHATPDGTGADAPEPASEISRAIFSDFTAA